MRLCHFVRFPLRHALVAAVLVVFSSEFGRAAQTDASISAPVGPTSVSSDLSRPKPPRFIAPDAVDFLAIIPPPPPPDSPADRADLLTLLHLQADRTPHQIVRAERVAAQDVFSFAGPVLGAWFNARHLPKTAAFFSTVTEEEYAIATLAKNHFNRPRPVDRDPQIKPSVAGRSRSKAYPSGHTSDAAAWSVILAEIFPQHRAAFLEQVREVAWGRILAGVHYPTDTQAGQILGEAVAREMLKNPVFRADLAEVSAECLAAMRPPTRNIVPAQAVSP